MGYGRPDWGVASPKKPGWIKEDGGWRFYLGDSGEYVKNDWYKDQGKWYWFDGAGIMVTKPVTLTPDSNEALQVP